MKKKVLIVEDDSFLVDAYRAKSKKESFLVEVARDGNVALEKVASFKPDLIILDLLLPQKDGFEVLTALQADEEMKKIPVVVASNLDDEESMQKCLKLGAKEYFIKSNISINDLMAKSQAYLK